jgi:hypothetical protein
LEFLYHPSRHVVDFFGKNAEMFVTAKKFACIRSQVASWYTNSRKVSVVKCLYYKN